MKQGNKIKASVITSTKANRLSKQFEIKDGKLKKSAGGQLVEGKVKIETVSNLSEFCELIERLDPNQTLYFGVSKIPLLAQSDISGFKTRTAQYCPWTEVPAFILGLDDSVAAQALLFLILTATRTGDVLNARWSEINFDEMLWIIPAGRRKAMREHMVPLTKETVAILKKMIGLDREFVFPGLKPRKGLSNAALSQILKQIGRTDITVHGFRSSFRVWAEENGNMPREVVEFSLAHEVGSAVDRAYQRSDLIDKRRVLMTRWARFCLSADLPKSGGEDNG